MKRFRINNEEPRVSPEAVDFMERMLNKELNYLAEGSVIDFRIFTKTTGNYKLQGSCNGRCRYITGSRIPNKPKHIRITVSIGPNIEYPYTRYDWWRSGHGKFRKLVLANADEHVIIIAGHEIKHAMMYYYENNVAEKRHGSEVLCDVYGYTWLEQWREEQAMKTFNEAEFLRTGEKVDYKNAVCKVVFQFLNKQKGQLVHLVDSDGNEYRNVPFNVLNKTDDVMPVQKAAKNTPAVANTPKPKAGVIETIINTLLGNALTKNQLLNALEKTFPDRDREKMKATVNTQLNRLKAKYIIKIDGNGSNKTFCIEGTK